ncbi:DsbA family protein [Microbacterium sp. P02]|uniref:DsbA family protein n=1 Tax=unclassified Microbacterium TaxID=2609290 RepID=UPI00366DEFD3
MSSDDPTDVPVPSDRRDAVREKAQQLQAKQSRARLLGRASLIIGVVAVVAVAAVVVSWAFSSASSQPVLQPVSGSGDGFAVTSVAGVTTSVGGGAPAAGETPTPTPTPAAAEATAEATPAPTATRGMVDIRVYVDYLSVGSKEFQAANVQQLAKWVGQDAATLTYYPVAMLSAKSNGTKYSLRAASAAACVATHAPDTFFAYNNALLAGQPDVDSDGPTDQDLATLAIASGISSDKAKDVQKCIEDEAYAVWARNATDRALDGLPDTDDISLTGTPTVLVNGTPYVGALNDPKEFAQFVLTIASDSYYSTPTPTPSVSPTATPTPSS